MKLTATIEKEELSDAEPIYVALCPELDITSQGETQQEALMNLNEAIGLFMEDTDDAELGRRLRAAYKMGWAKFPVREVRVDNEGTHGVSVSF